MIKIEVTHDDITVLGHAMYDDYGKDIVCAAVSSVITTSVEIAAAFNIESIDLSEYDDKLIIVRNMHDETTEKIIYTMLNLLKELEKKYPKNIKITNKEE